MDSILSKASYMILIVVVYLAVEGRTWLPPAAVGHNWTKVTFTLGHVAHQTDFPYPAHGEILKYCNGQPLVPIQEVNNAFLEDMKMRNYGVLVDSRYLQNVTKGNSSPVPCAGFEYADAIMDSNGTVVRQPFVSVKSYSFEPGTTLYVKEMDGLALPYGLGTHSGCLIVDEVAEEITYDDDNDDTTIDYVHEEVIFVYSLKIYKELTTKFDFEQPLNVLVNSELCRVVKTYPFIIKN